MATLNGSGINGGNVLIDPTGLSNVTSTDVQGAISELDAVAGGGGVVVQDEGVPLVTTKTTLNFTGAGVTATGSGATATIDIPGGGGGDPTFTGLGIAPAITTVSVATDSAHTMGITVAAEDPTGNDSAAWFIRALAEDQNGVRAIVGSSGTGSPMFATGGAAGWTMAIGLSGSDVVLTGGSALATTLWTVKVSSTEAV